MHLKMKFQTDPLPQPPDAAAAGHNDPVTGLSADGTFHLLSVRGPLTNQFPRT
jgi:hypothetical protein